MYPKCLREEEQPSQKRLLCESLFCTHKHTHACAHTRSPACSTRSKCLTSDVSREGEAQQDLPASYLQEIAPLAVDIYKVVVYRDELLGLSDEEGCTMQLWLVCSEGELPLYTQHVNAPWRNRDTGQLPQPAGEGDTAPAPMVQGKGGARGDPHAETRLVVRKGRPSRSN